MEVLRWHIDVLNEVVSHGEDFINGLDSRDSLEKSIQKARKLLDGRILVSANIKVNKNESGCPMSKTRTLFKCVDCGAEYDSFEKALNCCI